MGKRMATRAPEGSMIAPNLSERIAWYQERMRPEDPAFGNGIADWTITSEYDADPQSENGSGPIWGCMCSPSVLASEGIRVKLQPSDIAAKRAHIVVRTPKSEADIDEIERTILHELGHVLVAPMKSEDREAEENAMHSLDHFFSKTKLSPEQGAILARSFQNPMARAYRAKEKAMPDMEENKDKPDKGASEGGKKPAMQVRSVPEIEADLIKAVLAGQPTDELAKELVAAKAMAEAGGPASEPAPAPAPEMGMKPEEAYARKVKAEAQSEAVKAFVDALELPDDKKAFLRKQPTIVAAKDALAFLPKEGAKMGFDMHPAMRAKGDDDEPASVFYPSGNKTTMAACRVMARKKDGISARGIYKCTLEEQRQTGQLMRFSLTDAYPMLREVAEQNARRDQKANLSSIGGDK